MATSSDLPPQPRDDLFAACAQYVAWCAGPAFTLWSTAARDPEGGFFEALAMDGSALRDRERRTRVQPRQAYAFAHLARLGVVPKGAARGLADHAMDYVARVACAPATNDQSFRGMVHRLSPDHGVANPLCDLYDHAFLVLAWATYAHAFGETGAIDRARSVLTYLDQEMREGDGSYREGVPPRLPRRQNPHMHLFEATMALAAVTGAGEDKARATALFELFRQRFFDGNEGVIREFFEHDLSPTRQHFDLVEPGHMAEWCWLLGEYQALTGTDTATMSELLYQRAAQLGQCTGSPFLLDTVSIGPSPAPPMTRRTWVQTEYLKATLSLIRRGRTDLVPRAQMVLNAFMNDYLTTDVAGGYIDQFDADGQMVSADMPTSTFYHLVSLAAEAQRMADWLRTGQ